MMITSASVDRPAGPLRALCTTHRSSGPGIVLQFARGEPLQLFGLFEIPSPWSANRPFARTAKEVHEVLANELVIFAVIHAVAALVHHWFFRDRTLVRMLPGATR